VGNVAPFFLFQRRQPAQHQQHANPREAWRVPQDSCTILSVQRLRAEPPDDVSQDEDQKLTDLTALRRQLKRNRLALPPDIRASAEANALRRIQRVPQFRRARRIAGYVGSKGEVDPMPLLTLAAQMGKACYLPVLHPFRKGRLWFRRWCPGDQMKPNRFGILEPLPGPGELLAARHLDLVIVPLLGFDSNCHRLGMGGGYYDRSFAFSRHLEHAKRPYLLGLAHESQRIDHLNTQPWDVTLDAVVTDRNHYQAPRQYRI
jgi:5-formyltetrahydrofolate cyclo-ligase